MPTAGGYSAGSIFLQVVPSFAGFEAAARRTAKKMEGIFEQSMDEAGDRGASKARKHMDDALGGPNARASGKRGGQAVGDEFSGAFEGIIQKRLGKAIAALGDNGNAQIKSIEQRLNNLKGAKVGIDLDAGTLLAEIKAIDAEIARLTKDRHLNIDARVDSRVALDELRLLNREVTKIDGKKISVKADVDTGAATAKLTAFNRLIGRSGNQAEDTANSFRTFNGVLLTAVTIGPALIPILTAIAGGMLALGPAAAVAVAGVGGLLVAFSGLGNAIQALNDVQQNAGKDALANSKRMRQAAQSVQDAETRLARARRDAAQSAEDSEKRVADAKRNAARSIETALGRQQDAEKRLSDTVKDATQAQNDLIAARRQAQQDLDDIADRQRKNRVDERQAVIDLFNATVEYNAVKADGGATNLEQEQASINLENARIRLSDIRKEEKDLAEQRAKGVKGSQVVQSAEQKVADTLEAQKEAQKALKDATADVTQARIEGARDVADAVEQQRREEVSARESITDAQKALTREQLDYKDALQQTGEVGSASMQKLQQAMSVLGPEGQAFARFIFGLKDEFYAIRDAVQAGLFPGLTEGIQLLVKTYLPSFTEFMGELGSMFGDMAKLTAQTLTSDTWKQFFATFREISPDIIKNYSVAFLNLATAVAQILTITAPFAVAFSKAFADLTAQFAAFVGSTEGQKLLTDFLDEVKRLGPDVLRFFEALAPAFFALLEALMPLGDLILRAVTGFLEWIAAMDPKTLQAIVFTVITLIAAFQIAAGVIAGLAAIFTPFGATIGVVVVAIVALIGVLVWLYTTSDTARAIINTAFSLIATAVKFYFEKFLIPYWTFWGNVIVAVAKGLVYAWTTWIWPTLKAIYDFVSDLWRDVLHPVFSAFWELVSKVFTDIKWAWENILWPVLKVLGKIVLELWELSFKVAFNAISAGFSLLAKAFKWTYEHAIYPVLNAVAKAMGVDLNGKSVKGGLVAAFEIAFKMIGTMWDGLKKLAKGPIDFVVRTVFNQGLIGAFNWLAGKLGMDKVDPIPWPPKGFARGGIDQSYGVRPGYTPGRDTHLIAVSGGEAILRPEVTRALGSDWVYGVNAAARTAGVKGARKYMGFANGGIFWPTPGYAAGTPFGKKGPMWSSGYHTGQDFPAPLGTPIHAVMSGIVSSTAWSSWGGNLTRIITKGLGEWFYAHQSGQSVHVGDAVQGNQVIGYVGATGNVTGPHLHLELRVGGRSVDPMRTLVGGMTGVQEKPAEDKQSRLESILSKLGSLAGAVKDAVSSPLEWLKGKVEGPIKDMTSKFGDTWLTRGLGKLPDKFFGALVDRIKGLVGMDDQGDMGQWSGAKSDLQRMVQQMAASKYGWSGGEWSALNWLVSHESSWNPNAQNPTSTAYGLFQFLNGTWGPYGPKTSDPKLQAQYGMEYIKDRYGSPSKAKEFWEGHHWYADGGVAEFGPGGAGLPDNGTMMYDNGGYLPPGLTTVVNLTGKPEPVFTSDQFDRMRGGDGGGFNYSPTFVATDLTAEDVASDILFAANRVRRGGVYAGGRP